MKLIRYDLWVVYKNNERDNVKSFKTYDELTDYLGSKSFKRFLKRNSIKSAEIVQVFDKEEN